MGLVIAGGVVSVMFTVNFPSACAPKRSLPEQYTAVKSNGKIQPETGSHFTTGFGSAVPDVQTFHATAAPSSESAAAVIAAGRCSLKMPLASRTSIEKFESPTFPAESTAVQRTVDLP